MGECRAEELHVVNAVIFLLMGDGEERERKKERKGKRDKVRSDHLLYSTESWCQRQPSDLAQLKFEDLYFFHAWHIILVVCLPLLFPSFCVLSPHGLGRVDHVPHARQVEHAAAEATEAAALVRGELQELSRGEAVPCDAQGFEHGAREKQSTCQLGGLWPGEFPQYLPSGSF